MKKKIFRQLIINPGSASTKLAVYENESCLFEKKIEHPATDLQKFPQVADQRKYRLSLILDTLAEKGVPPDSLAAVVGRGGLLQPMESGTYTVNEKMKHDLIEAPREEHAANLGALLADEIAGKAGIPAFIVDPVCTDEMDEVARISGLPELERVSLCHTLNMKAVARKVAANLGRRLEDCNFVVAHLGSGITVSPFKQARIVDCNSAIQEGPFSPVRCGGLPAMELMKLCYSGSYSFQEMYGKLMKHGGMQAYLGTNDVQEAEKRAADGDEKARLVLEAMAYQIRQGDRGDGLRSVRRGGPGDHHGWHCLLAVHHRQGYCQGQVYRSGRGGTGRGGAGVPGHGRSARTEGRGTAEDIPGIRRDPFEL